MEDSLYSESSESRLKNLGKGGRKVNRKYSNQEIERILRQDLEIPHEIEQGMQSAYQKLGMEEQAKVRLGGKIRMWKVLAAVAILAAGSSLVVLAANTFLSANLVKDEDSVKYDLTIDRQQEAHEIEVEPTYMPEGYVLGDENTPFGGKWHNYETGGGITITAMNAAELDEMIRLGDIEMLTNGMREKHLRKEIEINGMKTALFVSDRQYVDSDKKRMDVRLFNEEEGYLIEIFNMDTILSEEEIIKVAEGLDIKVLDTVVPYKSDAEIQAILEERKMEASNAKGLLRYSRVKDNCFFAFGEELKVPYLDPQENTVWNDIRYTVESVEIKDQLLPSEYPIENYPEYEMKIADWVNEDGTLKPYERYKYTLDENGNRMEEEDPTVETVQSKYVVVKMKVKNCNTENPYSEGYDVSIAPSLEFLNIQDDGIYHHPINDQEYYPANEGYALSTEGFPVYFDKMYFTEGIDRLKHAYFVPMEPGEELEYTLVYVADEDRLDNAFLYFYGGYNAFDNTWKIEEGGNDFVYVKVMQ